MNELFRYCTVAEIRANIVQALILLSSREWTAITDGAGRGYYGCPVCKNTRSDGHKETCEFGQATHLLSECVKGGWLA